MNETDKARAALVELMPPQYERYINTKLAGDFAWELMKQITDKPTERPAVIVIHQQSPSAYARDCNAAYAAGYRFVSAAFPYAVMQLTLDAQKKDRKAKQQSKAGEGRTLTGGMTL